MHTWDVGSLTGSEVDFPDDLLAQVDAFAHQVLDAVPRDHLMCANPVSVQPGANLLDRLVVVLDRQP